MDITGAATSAVVIVSARITPLPRSFCDPVPEIIVTDSTGRETMIFSYYPDEISFTEVEFVGLTLDEARRLKSAKDRVYLQS